MEMNPLVVAFGCGGGAMAVGALQDDDDDVPFTDKDRSRRRACGPLPGRWSQKA